jgi:hypothetical protein
MREILSGFLLVATLSTPAARGEVPMKSAAEAFLASLDPAARAKASLPFDSEDRLDWHYVPRARGGMRLVDMTEPQKAAALRLLRAGLSGKGFTKAETIRRLEDVLFAIEGSARRNPEHYNFTIFGAPSDTETWGWRYEGHHTSLHWTVVRGRLVATTPQFLGANPADVRSGPMRGTRALAAEEDLARSLVRSLDPAQRAKAVIAARAPHDILTGASRKAAIRDHSGIPFPELTAEQRGLLISLVEEYAGTQIREVAEARLAKVKAELPHVKLAWMGGLEKGQGHYYRIQGSTFLIEYDNTQDGANHIHCVWRELDGDWGLDLLEEHYRTSPHHSR